MKKSLILVLFLSLLAVSCGDQEGSTNHSKANIVDSNQTLQASEKYHATVKQEMTLAEVAKINSISEYFLKQKLGIPQYVNHPYTVLELSRNYKFKVGDLKRIIEKQKDKKTLEKKIQSERSKVNK